MLGSFSQTSIVASSAFSFSAAFSATRRNLPVDFWCTLDTGGYQRVRCRLFCVHAQHRTGSVYRDCHVGAERRYGQASRPRAAIRDGKSGVYSA
jgi:hypothetical protein